ncbi:MAG: RNA polymerase sigma factor [Candidatus Paceibacterota bacterium]|jgi:RNA polymerase sigma-70 factor (ECF subfamily)
MSQIKEKKNKENKDILNQAHQNFSKGLNSYAYFKIHNRTISTDLVQDTFIKTWSYLVRGGKIDIMKAFLYHILNNLIVDQYRKHKTLSLDDLMEKGFEPKASEFDPNFDILDGKTAQLMIKCLPDKYRKVMLMRYVQELTLKEISLITGKSKNNIAVQIHRGLEKLKLLYRRA